MTYYNEIDAYCAQWLRNLIGGRVLPDGDVDERSIEDVSADDLAGYTQCHFFAGIGVWPYVLRRTGWPDDRPVWTGSCPCQPFSAAGKRLGTGDARHLWPAWFRLIEECRPVVCFGEQVASSDGLAWLDLIHSDLEGAGYAVGTVDLCAAGFGAPHIRQRLYFVAYTLCGGIGYAPRQGLEAKAATDGKNRDIPRERLRAGIKGPTGKLADSDGQRTRADPEAFQARRRELGSACDTGDAESDGRIEGWPESARQVVERGPTNGFWRDAEWLHCTDGKARAVEPGTFPLAPGSPGRVGRLCAYGNALCAPQAEAFIRAAMECLP